MSEGRNKQTQYPSEESSDSSSSEEFTDNKCDDDESEASYDELDEDTDSSEELTDKEKTPDEESSSYNSDDDESDDDDDDSLISNDLERRDYVRGAIGPHTGHINRGEVNCEETSQHLLYNYFEMKRNDIRKESDDDSASEDSDSDSKNKTTITIDVGTNTEVVKGKLTMSKVEVEDFCEVKQEGSVEGGDKILETDDLQGYMYAYSYEDNSTNKEAAMSQSRSLFYNKSTQTDFVDVDPSGHQPVPCIQSDKFVGNVAESQISKYSQKNTQTDTMPCDPLNQSSQETQTDDGLFLDISDKFVGNDAESEISKYSQKTTQTDALPCDPLNQSSQETQTDGLFLDMTESPSEGITETDLRLSVLATQHPDMTIARTKETYLSPRVLETQHPGMTISGITETVLSPCVSATQHPNMTISTQPETLLTLLENLVQEEEGTEDETKTSEDQELDGTWKSETASAESIQFDLEKGIPCDKLNKYENSEMGVKIRNERIPTKLKKARNKTHRENSGNLNHFAKDTGQKHPILLKKTKRKTRLCPACSLLSRDMMTVRHVCQSHRIPKGQGTAVSQAQYRMLYHYRWPQLTVTRF
ncbi:dentin sialophosphoprotein-like [Saccostrea echinata]|uniref:dentin sialophosphoprotein-like n=1 Tax=Saccostrea echinata TaxID=191078 RepID=UPI002A81AD3C|nr:dentin sialophosphoprotein-like [Saccostrea echinata]